MKSVTKRQHHTLAAWRYATGLSQSEAARVLGISQTFYSRLERRLSLVRGRNARRVQAQTGVPVEWLVGADL